VLSANTDGRDMAKVIADIRAELAAKPLPEGYFTALEGQFQAQEQATRLIALLATLSLTMIFMVLYSRYRSAALTLIIMGNIPLALVGSVVALWISGPTAVGGRAGRLYHADRHRHAQRHPQDQPLHQPVRAWKASALAST
jgi:HME family heavy-metal exporter